ncbi:MAG: dienelactone hydrolase [Pseudomonadota bacterium]
MHGRASLTVCGGVVAILAGTAVAGESVGVTTLQVAAPDRGRELAVTLWYPADPGGTAVLHGDTPVFEGTEALAEAPVAGGPFPLVLVAHGGMRSAPHLSGWIGAGLAANGVLAAVVHPPRLGPDDAAIAVQEIWKRPADLSAVLTALETDPDWSAHIDADRVGGVGFFLGGTSVLTLAGAEIDAVRYARSCDDAGAGMDCAWLAESGVDLDEVDLAPLGRSQHDPRVRTVVAVDPELTESFAVESVASIDVPVEIINLGSPGTIMRGLDASGIVGVVPDLSYTTVADATPFSAFSVCKPRGPAILADETGSDALCRERGETSREAIHATLAAMIVDALDHGLSATD